MPSFHLIDDTRIEYAVQAVRQSKGMKVTIGPKTRTNSQNSYYFNCLEIIAKDIGEDKNDLHDMIKLRVFGPQLITIKGETVSIPKRSSDLSVADFSKLLDAALMLASAYGIIIPSPATFGLEK